MASSLAEGPSMTPHYTCLIRLPFPRGDFVDPPPVEWDATKDKALWKIISKAANSKDLDWPELSNRFQVSLSFLLQQAAWLYERHFAQMRAQMKKLGASNAPSPVPPQDATAFQRPSSQTSRAPSALSIHNRDSVPAASVVSPVRAHAPPMSRTPSTNTVTQSRYPSSQHEHNRSFRSSLASQRRPSALDNIIAESRPSKLESSSSSGASSSLDERPTHPSLAKSQVFRRPPDLRAIASDGDGEEDDDDDDDSSSGFLPFASRDQHSATTDQTATLRRPTEQGLSGDTLPTRKAGDMATPAKQKNVAPGSSRTTPGPAINNFASPKSQKTVSSSPAPGALSPRRKAGLLREGSESSPSMGSSFSDLDDASVTQSALEDALLSKMQAPGASRMSTFSAALRSRYLPQ